MSRYIVSSGVTSSGVTLSSGDVIDVLSGGISVNTTALSGGLVNVYGTASSTILMGGRDVVEARGSASGTVISSGGIEYVSGTVSSASVRSGGLERIYSSTLARC